MEREPGFLSADRRLVEDSIHRGLDAYDGGDYPGAARALGEALPRLEREIPELWDRLGKAYFWIGEHGRAVELLGRVVLAGVPDAETFALLGTSCSQLGRHEDAAGHLESALALAPDDPKLWRRLGREKRSLGDSAGALACYERAIRLCPSAAGVFQEIGSLQAELKAPDEAITAYREALRLEPTRSDTWTELGRVYSTEGRFEESDACLREAIRVRPENADAWHAIAINTLRQGEPLAARKAYQRLRELNPDFAQEILGWVSRTSGLPTGVLEDAFERAVPKRRPAKRRGRLLFFRRRPA
jgi:tetratricopeptide (TPR) repeat protein